MDRAPPVSLSDLTPERLQGLSPQLRRAARFLVENPGDIATRTQRHVSEAADLPAPTFTRLAQAVGLRSYDQLRDLCRNDILQKRTRLADRARKSVDAEAVAETPLVYQHAEAAIRNVQVLADRIDASEMMRAAQLLAKARQVVLVGEMSMRPLADLAAYIANMSLTGWKVLGSTCETLSSELAVLGSQDACLVASISPYSNQAIRTAQRVKECDVSIVAVTDNVLSPLAALADHKFFVNTESPQFFPSHVPAMVVFETLLDMVIRERGTEAQKHIAAVERQNHKLDEYWRENTAGTTGSKL